MSWRFMPAYSSDAEHADIRDSTSRRLSDSVCTSQAELDPAIVRSASSDVMVLRMFAAAV